ncbi:beta-ketoacyl-[acyl-carrier-protein] synthase family protein [Pendulispora rubella]|uniref:Beta-ketoacyl-[acyl-carrier-protein] synthase family protein n=1 Tax=Pendulispora rubella TaxID=2741070 RepID=A0ABZ2L794_9BACT
MTHRRVVVTGCGAVSPLGLSADAHWEGLVHGRSGIDFIRSFDARDFPVKVAGEVKDFTVPASLPRTLAMAFTAAEEAAAQAGLHSLRPDARCGVYCGGTMEWPDLDDELVPLHRGDETKPRAPSLLTQRRMRLGGMATLVARRIGIASRMRGAQVIDGACASGGMAIGEAFHRIRAGVLDVAVSLGACSWTNLVGLSLYYKLAALSSEASAAASRPFDAKRSGFVMAEGAGAVILEPLEQAQARGAIPLAEVTGYGVTGSAFRITDMPDEGIPQHRAMDVALRDARRSGADVDYINAHGTATQQNDVVETQAIRRLLGARARDVPISSNKSMTGHSITAAGALEAIATIYTIREGIIPPTINLHNPDPQCDLDYVPNTSRRRETRVALSNAFGFGGHNCALVLEAYTG